MKQQFSELGLGCQFQRINKNGVRYGQKLNKIMPFYKHLRYDEQGTLMISQIMNACTSNKPTRYYSIPRDEMVENR